MITQDELKQRLQYDPESGAFTWRKARGRMAAGAIAGTTAHNGYRHINTGGKVQLAHRLAFVYMTGEMPPEFVDHINGNRSDNRWENLRAATAKENQRNQKRPRTNSSGVIGVHWSAAESKWAAQIKVNRQVKWLGYFDSLKCAAQARREAEARYGFHPNHGRAVQIVAKG